MTVTGRSSPMHRVLAIPELLDIIFTTLDQKTNAVNAQVCKKWSHIALDCLWKDVDDLKRLFGILAPLRESSKPDEYEFSELPDATHWKRFEQYSARVRRLVYNHPTSGPILRQSVFDDIARTRTTLNFLPNMHTLMWKGPLNLCVMFMHSSIKSFVIWLSEEVQVSSPQPFFRDVAVRMPNLTNVNFQSYVAIRNIEADIIQLIEELPKLQSVTFPRWYLTSRITDALSKLPQLGVIEFQYLPEQGCGDPEDVVQYTPTLAEGAFPALWDFSLTAGFADTTRFLELQFAPTNLTSLYIDSELIELASTIHDFLSSIADNCQLLKFLALVSFRDANAPEGVQSSHAESDDMADYEVTMDHLKPVLKLPNLTSLELLHHHPLALKSDDIEVLAKTWPALDTLILSNEPVVLNESLLTLDDLLPFARHCPKLTHLGMFIDTTATESPLDSKTISNLTQFKSLRRLSMGVSLIPNTSPTSVDPAALYLSHILPLNCTLDCGITWDDSIFAAPETGSRVFDVLKERCDGWLRVAELLPVLVRLRTEERERTREMERELDDLRMRASVIMAGGQGVRVDFTGCVMI